VTERGEPVLDRVPRRGRLREAVHENQTGHPV
jgi:hypothetical protein